MKRKGLRIALYTDYIDSDYVQKIHEGAWKFCKEKNIELIEFPAGEINSKVSHNYQLTSIAAHIKNTNLDGLIFFHQLNSIIQLQIIFTHILKLLASFQL